MLRSLDHVPIGTVIYTEVRGVVFASESFGRIVGCELSAIYGKHMEDFTHEGDWAANRWLLGSAISNRQPFTLKKRYVRPTGEVVWVENHYQILESQSEDLVVCLLSRELGGLPDMPALPSLPAADCSDYVAELSLDLSAMAAASGREMASDLLRLVAKVAWED